MRELLWAAAAYTPALCLFVPVASAVAWFVVDWWRAK